MQVSTMEFKLDPSRRNIQESDLLGDLKTVSRKLGKRGFTEREYNSNGLYSANTIRRRFGSWNIALECAGLKPSGSWYNIPKETYIQDVRRVADLLGKQSLTKADYDDNGKFSSAAISSKFGSWFKVLEAAGLKKSRNLGITNEQYFLNLERVWRSLGRQPVGADMRKPLSEYSVDAYADRFGTWRKALEAFVEYVNSEDPLPERYSQTYEDTANEQSEQKAASVKKSRYISWRLRFLVMRRDGFRCCNCGRSPATEPGVILHIDHSMAWSKGGSTTYDNLQTLCSVCNIGKSDLEAKD